MVIQIDDDFDPDKIADSGQCFRWEKISAQMPSSSGEENVSYRILAGSSCLYFSALGDGQYRLDCTQEEYENFWRDYFDLGQDYRKIRERIDPGKDPFLWKASEHEKGIRILQQDPWEMLISFIISQNRNIPAIRRSVEYLARACGDKKTDSKGLEYYAFPDCRAVAALTEKELSECRLGYRCRYVHEAAEAAARGEFDPEALKAMDEKAAMAALTKLTGVGVKVASCVSLFGLHQVNAFPVDVWMKRILAEQYPGGYPFEEYAPYNGIYQQYMFAYYRKISE